MNAFRKYARWARLALTLAAALVSLAPAAGTAWAGDKLLVFAAASTRNAVSELGGMFGKKTGQEVVGSFASSSTLAKQIKEGAPAAVYISANEKWMDFLDEAGLLEPGTRQDLLGNSLVFIAPADSAMGEVKVASGLDLAGMLGDGRLALGDPAHVPAGMYAHEALVYLGLWDSVKDKTAPAADVRRALALVETGEAPLGVVYLSDALVSRKVKVLGRFPADSHKPIVYPAALLKGQANGAAKEFLSLLSSPAGAEVFRKYGFEVR